MKIEKTPYFSCKINSLAKGCQYCVKGEKLVLFITGICNRSCFYCPLSEQKKNKDVFLANEWSAETENKGLTRKQADVMLKEAKLCNAKGAGITGGDPLLVNERTVSAIKILKKKFGRRFHIHLYTSLNNVTKERLDRLYSAGLDEIRLHPEITDERYWNRMDLVNEYKWDVGVEIPAIPKYEKQTRKLIDHLDGKIKFLNLNELEISDTNATNLVGEGYVPKDRISYGVYGSEQLAMKLMKHIIGRKYRFSVHFCTCRLKDAVQLAKRIKKRAKNAAYPFDRITKDGMLIRGAIYLKELAPSFSYRQQLREISASDRKKILKKLALAKKKLKIKDILVDVHKLRLIGSRAEIRKNSGKIKSRGLVPAEIEEYPTFDATEIEVNLL